jgi:eukaryotic-like serine/threonine-protein kinase
LAYTSDETKRDEVYVQSFPNPGGKWQISTNGGQRPIWSRDGKELFFLGSERKKMMVVDVKSGATFQAGVPKPLFDTHLGGNNPWFDVSKDGRFLIPTRVDDGAVDPITVVVNWPGGLKK